MDWLAAADADIVCLQETRAEAQQLPDDLRSPAGYHAIWNPSRSKKGYSGTAILTREMPLHVELGLGVEAFDAEGRTIIAEYPNFILLNSYFPNGGRDHARVPFKLAFYDAFLDTCEKLRAAGKQVLFCGDVNTAHREIDLARPKENQTVTGFLPEERAWIDQVAAAGYADTFRHFYPDLREQYTWWHQVTFARQRNVGWRIDYFFSVAELLPRLVDAFILPDVMGSDHCPVGLVLAV
ncbi:MAG TPA: exodeoxyribonuclease III [Anaerolineae bacterium]|nr:exodeoxyribonuclease III [Anaerolineae bacterium]